MRIHPKITVEAILAAVERRRATLDDPGFCVHCGVEAHGVEPDARRLLCESCGERGVYGCEDLLMEIDVCPLAAADARVAAEDDARYPGNDEPGRDE